MIQLKLFLKIAILFFVMTAVLTYPLILKVNSVIPGFHSTDEAYGALWNFWWLKYVSQNHLPETNCYVIAAPFGIDNCKSGYPLWSFINKWLSIITTNVFAYNAEVILSFFLTALFMYQLSYHVTANIAASIISSIIFTFCPTHFLKSWQHLGLALIQWIPLYILALIKSGEKSALKQIIYCTISLYLVFAFDLYYAYFMLIATIIFLIYLIFFIPKSKVIQENLLIYKNKSIMNIFISLTLVFILILPSTLLIFSNRKNYKNVQISAHNPYHRPFEDLFSQSARPLSYLLPASTHPIFGKFTENFIGTSLYGESFTEHTLYLGWVPLVLAFVAAKRWRKKRKQPPAAYRQSPENFYIGLFVFLAVVAWLFSQPPWWQIGPVRIYMPSFFMYKVLPMYRAYCRFGIVVMLAVGVLAGFGLKFVLERFKNRKTQIAVTTLFCGLILFEFWNYPPLKVIDVSNVPAVYYWLKGKPGDFVVAEYPLDASSPNEMYKFYQTKHEKKIINGTIPGTYANKVAQSITRLSDLNTVKVLKWMGVKYVLVHQEDYLKTDFIDDKEDLKEISKNPGLKLISSFPAQECPDNDIMCVQKTGPIDVYEVIAAQLDPKIKN